MSPKSSLVRECKLIDKEGLDRAGIRSERFRMCHFERTLFRPKAGVWVSHRGALSQISEWCRHHSKGPHSNMAFPDKTGGWLLFADRSDAMELYLTLA